MHCGEYGPDDVGTDPAQHRISNGLRVLNVPLELPHTPFVVSTGRSFSSEEYIHPHTITINLDVECVDTTLKPRFLN
jgi:hypothetical protein